MASPTTVERKQVRLRRRTLRDRPQDVRLFVVLLAVLFVGFLLVLRYLVSSSSSLQQQATYQTEDLIYNLTMPKTDYDRGEPIALNLTVANRSGRPLELVFDNELEVEFVVQRELNLFFVRIPLEVWRYSATRVNRPQRHNVVIMPHDKKVFRAVWDQKDARGRQVGPGNYRILGYVTSRGERHELLLRGETD
ncbi:MAG TPA: BsuPI-related putative proteinase inhibitor [Candidatus Nitrosotenuis sp.]|jgi:hypothetical protein|nr:BsuPI-related putative proteinase inhibitor [Candidatus Nitrosotenuis sp.]